VALSCSRPVGYRGETAWAPGNTQMGNALLCYGTLVLYLVVALAREATGPKRTHARDPRKPARVLLFQEGYLEQTHEVQKG
jgi:hypothetical protein